MARRVAKKNVLPIGRTYTELGTDVVGYPVQAPLWYGDSEERIVDAQRITLTEQEVGWVIRLNDNPVISINQGDLVALGVALIKAGAR